MSYDNYNHTYRRNGLHEPSQLYADRNLFTPTATQMHMLGMEFSTNDGRKFRYCENGAVALAKGLMTQQAEGTANWQNEVQTNNPSLPAIGDKEVTVTLSSTVAKDDLIDGYLTVEDGTGETELYIIKDNDAGTANATTGFDVKIRIADEGGIRTAFLVTSEVTVTKNKYKDVIVLPTTSTGVPAGVPLTAVSANYYFWAQTKGPAPMIVDAGDTIVIGEPAGKPGTNGTAGAVGLVANDGTDCVYGRVMRAAAAGETAIIDLTLE